MPCARVNVCVFLKNLKIIIENEHYVYFPAVYFLAGLNQTGNGEKFKNRRAEKG